MKRTLYHILIGASLILSGCSGTEPESSLLKEGIEFTLKTDPSSVVTKASGESERDGVASLNENRITSVDYYIYNKADLSTPALFGRISTEAEGEKTFKIEKADFASIFAGGYTTAVLYSIVNYPSDAAPLTGTESLVELKQIEVEAAAFAGSAHTMPSFIMSGQSEITIDPDNSKYAEGSITVERTVAKFTLNLSFATEIFADENSSSTNIYWKPVIDEDFAVQFHNGAKWGCLDNNYRVDPDDHEDDFYFDSDDRMLTANSAASGEKTVYTSDPFYTCERYWDYGGISEPYLLIKLNQVECNSDGVEYAESTHRQCFYRVFLSSTSFEMNHWYDINLELKLLGSWDAGNPTVITSDSYYVVDWDGFHGAQDTPGTSATVESIRFLQMEQKNFDIYSLNTVNIPFATSHECEIVSITRTHEYYDGSRFTTETYNYTAADLESQQEFTFGYVGGKNVILFSHELNTAFGADMDTTPYTYTVTIKHKDAAQDETFTITQYPPITVSRELNNSRGGGVRPGDRGDVYVNGQLRYIVDGTSEEGYSIKYPTSSSTGGSHPRYNTVRYRTGNDATDANYTMYIIETQTLPEGTSYVVTDARSRTPMTVRYPDALTRSGGRLAGHTGEQPIFPDSTNTVAMTRGAENNVGLAVGPALYGGADGERRMKWYYATATTEESKNYISPKFRICSNMCSAGSVGNDADISENSSNEFAKYENWVKRCATYQEAGYPAGRWRLPTLAEIEYVARLQGYGLLPMVFDKSNYPCATSLIRVESEEGSFEIIYPEFTRVSSIRCVYDDWYWENTDDMVQNTDYQTVGGRLLPDQDGNYGTFVWGDMPR